VGLDLTKNCQFQSHNGAIAALFNEIYDDEKYQVSIPQWCDCCGDEALGYISASVVFQSHNGAIAAGSLGLILEASSSFQSHNGAIAAITTSNIDYNTPCFNPTMVRLLQDMGFGHHMI